MLLYYRFVNNLPCPDFIKGFLRRHKNLTVRQVNLTKRSRAAVSHEIVNAFFDNFYKVTSTTMMKPTCRKIQEERRASLREEASIQRRLETTQSQRCLLCSVGLQLRSSSPPYVVYKDHILYKCWMEGGPKGARYNSSPSGWFDMPICEDWFFET